MEQQLIGESAALLTSVMWTICSILFAYAGKKIGALSLNAVRIIIAIGFLGAAHIMLLGTILKSVGS